MKYKDNVGTVVTTGKPFPQPLEYFAEGHSYDFYIENNGKKIVTRLSCNYMKDQLKPYKDVDLLILGVTRLGAQSKKFQRNFVKETIEMVNAPRVLAVHWDNFFRPLTKPLSTHLTRYRTSRIVVEEACEKNNRELIYINPLEHISL